MRISVLAFIGIALAMGVGSIVIGILEDPYQNTSILLLSIGLLAIAFAQFLQRKN